MDLVLNHLSTAAFASYGQIIAYDYEIAASFQLIIDEPNAAGWRIAVNKVSCEPIAALNCHPNTRESFEPLSGVTVIVVANYDNPSEMEAFLLDQPVCIYQCVWHATLSISKSALVKITENHSVQSETYVLPLPLHIGLIT
jgi:ureidoglycolate hydrolase